MMAMTDQWRQPKARWMQYFRKWVDQPEPKALMLTCVFFDLRAIYGKTTLLDELRRDVLAHTRDNRIFLAYMVGNALSHTPPLGLFRSLSTIRSGDNKGTLDLKHNGIVPVVDLARVYALAGGHDAETRRRDGTLVVHEDLARRVRLRGRQVVIVFDAGRATNPMVGLGILKPYDPTTLLEIIKEVLIK